MAKENKKKLIIWALVALVIGVMLGLFITTAVSTGKATAGLSKATTDHSGLVEERRDLTVDNLNVNRINNIGNNQLEVHSTNEVLIDSQSTIGLDSEDAIKLYSGGSQIALYNENATDGPEISMGTEYAHINLHDLSINIDAVQVKFSQLPQIEQTNQIVEYFIGDTFIANTYIVEVMNIWDANGVVEMQLRKEGSPTITHFYGEGDYIIPNSVQVSYIDSNSVIVIFYPSTNAYLCIDQDGSIYRSFEPCR